jgi:hypothetical protein
MQEIESYVAGSPEWQPEVENQKRLIEAIEAKSRLDQLNA